MVWDWEGGGWGLSDGIHEVGRALPRATQYHIHSSIHLGTQYRFLCFHAHVFLHSWSVVELTNAGASLPL